MKKKKLSGLRLNKTIVANLNNTNNLRGGWITTPNNCVHYTKFEFECGTTLTNVTVDPIKCNPQTPTVQLQQCNPTANITDCT